MTKFLFEDSQGGSYKFGNNYPLDSNGRAFFYIKSDGRLGYVCHLDKW